MADTKQVDEGDGGARQDAREQRRVARVARRIGAFAKAHGGAEGQVAYLGERGSRIVLVGADGGWGDIVAPTGIARQAVEKSGITVHEDFDGEFAARVRTGPYEWSRMAGIQVGGKSNT
ncbi:hypothetical protein ABZ354_13110 [Streptomyces sp. NPDC005925]|uniref:hypothetical protein n=1 Tax=Streptomyces sp. NPDC005925 TaxID=3157172 RepID=UPI0033D6D49B